LLRLNKANEEWAWVRKGVDEAALVKAITHVERDVESSEFTHVLLAHDPDPFRAAAMQRVPITLSGHTHGGQVGLPFFPRLLNVSMLAHDYHLGLYRRDDSLLYVSPGLGTSGPPVRLGVPAAIVLHVLAPA
jgi:predicted MPP superfamily phosphohydrolase